MQRCAGAFVACLPSIKAIQLTHELHTFSSNRSPRPRRSMPFSMRIVKIEAAEIMGLEQTRQRIGTSPADYSGDDH